MDSSVILLTVVYIVLCGLANASVVPVDPCTSYEPLPRAEYRGGQCSFDADKAVCDVYLDDDTWYQAQGLNGYLTMQDSSAAFSTCGTKFPIWMNGLHPTTTEGEVERQGCKSTVVESCADPVTIRVKNCGAFYVYKMPRTSSCPEAYCFGETEPCPPFDPCDAYEHSSIDYDSTRSTSCAVSDVSSCDSLASDTWYKFQGQTNSDFLTIASSCPTSTTCGTESQLWINDHLNGTSVNTVCVKSGDNCCANTFSVHAKECSYFTVYQFPDELTSQCQRFCTDDPSSACAITTPAPPDPCTSYEPLPRAEYRGGQCGYDSDKAVCDVYLNDDTWYRAQGLNGYLAIQNSSAAFASCGTKFPIWMNGHHPTTAEGEVDRQGCKTTVLESCADPVTIRVKNCGAFYVYKMPRTASCPEAYCFGETEPCPPVDPCDYYENTPIPYDVARSTSCAVSDVSSCESLASDTWYKFQGQTNSDFLTIASSCPTSTTCGTESPLWINGIATEHANGTRTSYVCVRSGDDCCSQILELQSKQCAAGFTVYNFNQGLAPHCSRFCSDDTYASCLATTPPTTDKPGNKKNEKESVAVWLTPALVGAAIAGGIVGAVVMYAVVQIKSREKVGQGQPSSKARKYQEATRPPPHYVTGYSNGYNLPQVG